MTKKKETTPFQAAEVSFPAAESTCPNPVIYPVEDKKIKFQFTSSETALQTTINYLSNSVEAFEERVDKYLAVSDIREKNDEILAMKDELGTFKTEMVQQLTATRNSLTEMDKIVNGFIGKNTSFLTMAVEADGKFQASEGRLSALENRLNTLEGNKNISWYKNLGIVTAIIAFLGVCLACPGIAIALYAALK